MVSTAAAPQIALFKDLYEALRRVVADVRALAELPNARRTEVLEAISSAYEILDQATGLVISPFGKVIERGDLGKRKEFVELLVHLEYTGEWYEIEREMAMCSALRATHGELRRLLPGLLSRKSVKDWETLDGRIEQILSSEGELAEHITNTLIDLSNMAVDARSSAAGFQRARQAVAAARRSLQAERRTLIRDETAIYDLIY